MSQFGKKFIFFVFLLSSWWLVSCTTDLAPETDTPEQTAVTVKTAVPPIPTVTVTETAVTEEAITSLDTFIMALKQAVESHDYAQLQTVMSASFALGGWRSEWRTHTPDEALSQFENIYLPSTTAVQFSELSQEEIAALLDGQPPATMLGPDVNVATVLHSTGWGQTGADEALLFVVEDEDGRYTWNAFLYTSGSFAQPVTFLPAPIGLIFRTPDTGLWRVDENRQPQHLSERTDALPAPDGQHAFYIADGNGWLINLSDGSERQLTEDVSLAGLAIWGDADTLLLGVWLNADESEGPNNGHIARLNIHDGQLRILDEERLMFDRPALSPDGQAVTYSTIPTVPDEQLTARLYHADGGLQLFNAGIYDGYGALPQGMLFNSAWSPDGNKIAWLSSTGERVAVLIFDFIQERVIEIHSWDPARFGALIPSPVWSPDGKWLALEIWGSELANSGFWLLAADGSANILIDDSAGEPHWVNNDQFVYWNYDENRNGEIALFDVPSGASFNLDVVPFGSLPLAVVNTATTSETNSAAGQTFPSPDELEMSTSMNTSPDGVWQAITAQSDPIVIGQSEQFYTTLTVTDGTTTWTPVAEWRGYGLGYTWPSAFQWSQDGRFLYYTDNTAPDGCALFVNGTDLYRLTLADGSVTEVLAPNSTLNLSLSPDESMLAYIAWNGNMVALILSTIDTDGEQQVALTASGQYIQSGNLVWSPDGDSLLLTMVHDPCGSDWRHSIVRIDSSDLTAETLIDQDERLFTIREWSEADTALLTDNAGDTWQLNILTGDITQTDI